MIRTEDDLRAALRTTADRAGAPADPVPAVLGRARARRRARAGGVAFAVVVAVLAVTLPGHLPDRAAPPPVAAVPSDPRLLPWPARGPLRDDRALAEAALAEWRAEYARRDADLAEGARWGRPTDTWSVLYAGRFRDGTYVAVQAVLDTGRTEFAVVGPALSQPHAWAGGGPIGNPAETPYLAATVGERYRALLLLGAPGVDRVVLTVPAAGGRTVTGDMPLDDGVARYEFPAGAVEESNAEVRIERDGAVLHDGRAFPPGPGFQDDVFGGEPSPPNLLPWPERGPLVGDLSLRDEALRAYAEQIRVPVARLRHASLWAGEFDGSPIYALQAWQPGQRAKLVVYDRRTHADWSFVPEHDIPDGGSRFVTSRQGPVVVIGEPVTTRIDYAADGGHFVAYDAPDGVAVFWGGDEPPRDRVRGFGGPDQQLLWDGPVADPDVVD